VLLSLVACAIEFMEDNIAEPRSILENADLVKVSVRKRQRRFVESYGMSSGRFYRRMRAQQARRLVMGTELKLVDTAIAPCFTSTLRCFCLVIGVILQHLPRKTD